MLYMHDVWVNWFEAEENGYNVCYFHEWRKDDTIEMLDQIPLLYITDQLFNDIENNIQELPEKMLTSIYKQAFIRQGVSKLPLEYAAVVTNGKEIICFDTGSYQ